MNNNLLGFLQKSALPLLLCVVLFSCKKSFDELPENAVDHSQAYQNVNDAEAALIGIYGEVKGIAGQYVILNELRGDLMDVTPNANQYLKQLNTHSVTVDNPYADPRPFYKIIMDCNDALKNFNIMLKDNRITAVEYQPYYSAIGAVRSWLYLELGIQYGNVPYVTAPLENVDDVNNPNNYPRLSFDQLLDSLIQFTEALPTKDYSTDKSFMPIRCLLGDLYLWKGDYTQAAVNYHFMMNYADELYPAMNSEQWYETYKIAYTGNINGANWVNIFSQPYGERYSNYEIMWDMPFDKSYKPDNPFIKLFYNTGSDSSYLLKPSQYIINDWESQTRTDNTPGDFRGQDASWKLVAGHPVVNKYSSDYTPLSPFETNGKWILYRAAELHLRYAEAANRDDRSKLAFALLNWGLKYSFDPEHLNTAHDSRDVSDIEQSLGAPYDFDARQGDFPSYRGPWYRNVGIRGRVSLPLIDIDSAKYYNMNDYPRTFLNNASKDSLVIVMENKIIEEDARELAFEGHRWPDLLRVALRREKENPGSGVKFLQAKIKAEFDAAGEAGAGAAASAKLADPKNWYLPFKWK